MIFSFDFFMVFAILQMSRWEVPMDVVLYDRVKSLVITDFPNDLSSEDIKMFCDEHDVEFFAMGTPPGVGGSGWDDADVFRVSTRPGMFDGSPRGVTISFAMVREWKDMKIGMSAQL